MATPLYHMYGDDELNKDTLIKDESFIDDAANFLIEREGKKAEIFPFYLMDQLNQG